MNDKSDNPLTGIRVLDLTEERGLYTGKLLADFGADVIKIEEPDGSKARRIGPFKDDNPGLENSLYFMHFNINKRGITLDLNNPTARDIFNRLVKGADVVIEDYEQEKRTALDLFYSSLKKTNQRIIVASITGFGLDGPYSNHKAPDIVNFAMGGLMYISGEPDKPPIVAPCEQAYHSASTIAAFTIMAAIYERSSTDKGQYIEIASHDVMASINEELIMRYSLTCEIQGRYGSQHTTSPARIFPCKDGFVHVMALRPHHWESLVKLLGNPEIFMGDAWYDSRFRRLNGDIIDSAVTEFTMNHTKSEIIELCQTRNISCTPVNTPEDFATDSHVEERAFIGDIVHPLVGKHKYLKPPYWLSETPCHISRDATLLGQYNREIYCGELGYSEDELAAFKSQGII